LRKRATEADAKLKRLYGAIENGVADLFDSLLKDRIAELKARAIRPILTQRGSRMRSNGPGRRLRHRLSRPLPGQPGSGCGPTAALPRDHLRAFAQRVEVDQKELRIMGSKSVLLRTLVAASSAKMAGFGVPSSVPK
jgi:site-specific DNA recombinase